MGSSAHSASEKKAGWRKSLDKATSNKHTKNNNKGAIGAYVSDEILNMALSAIPLVTILAGRSFVNSYSKMRKRKQETAFSKNVSGPDDLPKKQFKGTTEDDMRAVNPRFNSKGYYNNCMYCTAVYDLRRRGFDVTANARSEGGNAKEVVSWYKDVTIKRCRTSRDLQKVLQQQEDGSRGYLDGLNSFFNVGHAVAYEKKNGVIKIIDAQANKVWDFTDFTNIFGTNYHVIRLDNCEINWSKIGEIIDPESLKKSDE